MTPVSTILALAISALLQQTGSTVVQTPASAAVTPRAAVPFGVGERMDYQVRFGVFPVGRGSIEVMKVDTVRGRAAWNVEMRVNGGALGYRLNSINASWIDTLTLSSLRYHRDQTERGRFSQRHYEIFPDRSVFRQKIVPDTLLEQPSMENPLDDASFVFFVRTIPLEIGQTYVFNRYFRPDRNPVTIKVLGRENVKVPLGTFTAIVIQPTIKTNGIFSEGGEARIWIADDSTRRILKLESKASAVGNLHLNMTAYTPPTARGGGSD